MAFGSTKIVMLFKFEASHSRESKNPAGNVAVDVMGSIYRRNTTKGHKSNNDTQKGRKNTPRNTLNKSLSAPTRGFAAIFGLRHLHIEVDA